MGAENVRVSSDGEPASPKQGRRGPARVAARTGTQASASVGRHDQLGQIIESIGPKLRHLRQLKGLSLQQLGERSDVSAAAIHKIERNGMVPTITTLMKLAVALNRPLSYFVEEGMTTDGPVILTPADERKPVFTSKAGLELRSITGPYGRFFMAGAAAVIEALADSGERPMEHPGEELVFVLEGALEFEVDGQTYRLSSGDSLHFRTDRPHRWRNPRQQEARAIWMALRPM